MKITLFTLLLFCFTCLAKVQKRIPPFGITDENSSQHLGDYTHSHETVDKSTFSCYPTEDCEVCSSLEKKTHPYCAEFGNKQKVRCEWDDPELADRKNQTAIYDDDSISLPSFRACPRVKRVEKSRFIKFEALNLIIAVISIAIFIWRQKQVAHEQYQRLAKRIGIVV